MRNSFISVKDNNLNSMFLIVSKMPNIFSFFLQKILMFQINELLNIKNATKQNF